MEVYAMVMEGSQPEVIGGGWIPLNDTKSEFVSIALAHDQFLPEKLWEELALKAYWGELN